MEKKKCSKCNKKKAIEEFDWRNKKEGKLSSSCKACVKIASSSHYQENKEIYIKRAVKFKKKRRKHLATRIVNYLKEHPCVDCGESDLVVLQFDHVRGVKKDCVGTMTNACLGWDTIWDEIQKCEVRCANCHFRKTAKERNWVFRTL